MPKRVRVQGVIYNVPDNATMDQIQEYVTSKGAKPPVTDTEMQSRRAASTAAAEKARPAFEGMGVKTALDIPLDIGIGIEQASGIDPMHPISSLPSAISGMVKSGLELGKEMSSGPVGQFKAALSMLMPAQQAVSEGGEALRKNNIPEAMQAAGRGYAAVAPLVEPLAHAAPSIGDIRAEATRLNIPPALELRAAANRAPIPPADLPTWGKRAAVYAAGQALGAPHVAEGLIGLDFARRWQPYRNAKAALQERLARGLVDPNATPPPLRETTIAARPEVALKDAPRMRSTTPFETETKPAAGPRQEIPFTGTEELTSGQPNFKSIEEKIAPSGARAKQRSQMIDANGQPTPFGRSLVEQVPELAAAQKGPKADAALMSGYHRVLQRVVETENAVPQETTVETTPIISQLGALEAEYIEKGLTKTATAIDKIKNDWVESTIQGEMAWGQFLRRKRAFFDEHNLSSSPMRRAYGILMEASQRAAPQLTEANRAYSTVRRALDNAKIDVTTGRRILDVGKEAKGKPTVSQMIEQSNPKTQRAPEPIKTRQEALDLLNPEEEVEELPEPETAAPREFPESVGKVGAGISGEAPSLTSTIDSRMRTFADMVESGATEMTGKAMGRETERGSANFGTEEVRKGRGGMFIDFPELEDLGRSPGMIAKAIRQGKGPLFTQIREAVKAAMQDELQSLSGTGSGPGALRERALGLMRQRLQQP